MSNLRRYFRGGDVVFLTHVTYERRPILADEAALFLECMSRQCGEVGVEVIAWVVLPDHVHLLVEAQEAHVPNLMRRIKLAFSSAYRERHGLVKGRLWQLRYWDHIIRDQEDMNRHTDYIHYNPVKHGYARDPSEWEWSSFGSFVATGKYEPHWGKIAQERGKEYGE